MAIEMTRQTADERREAVLRAALPEFARSGLHGTSTEDIASAAGISQPYLFRLFRTKKELFIACVDRAHEKVRDAFRRAVADAGDEDRLTAMGSAYVDELLPDRHAVLMQMQGYVASSDPEIQAHVRGCFERLVAEVTELSGADEGSVWAFFAQGMLLNVTQSLDLAAIADTSEWAASWCQGPPMAPTHPPE
jgi:AcrR family transcriptional regulator